jgi:phenylalanyl-tRNA synthetase beta chain
LVADITSLVGVVKKKPILKHFGIKQEALLDFNWDIIIKRFQIKYTEIPKYPEVRRDLALLIDKTLCRYLSIPSLDRQKRIF